MLLTVSCAELRHGNSLPVPHGLFSLFSLMCCLKMLEVNSWELLGSRMCYVQEALGTCASISWQNARCHADRVFLSSLSFEPALAHPR